MSIQYRSEHDSVGERSVPKDVYYGVQSLRAAENFPITGLAVHPEQINSIAEIKKASAITNLEIGLLDKRVADAIVRACDEIAAGRLHEAFIVDPIQGGAGTSLNMNANEVIANRAIELLGGEKGDYALVNPNDHVNYGQSTNDVFPSAGKLAVLKLLVRAQIQLERLSEALEAKAEEFDDVLKMGRTQMQDAVPIRLGQEFRAYSRVVRRDIARFERAKDEMRRLNMGGTAIGTGINADERYLRRIIPNLSKVTGLELVQASDLIDATQNLDGLVAVSGAVKTCARQPVQDVQRPAAHVLRPPLRLQRDQPAAPAERLLHHAGEGQPRHPRGGQPGGLQHHRKRRHRHHGRRGGPTGAQRLRAHHLLQPHPERGDTDLRGTYLCGQLRHRHHRQPGAVPGHGGAQRGHHHRPVSPRGL